MKHKYKDQVYTVWKIARKRIVLQTDNGLLIVPRYIALERNKKGALK